jgi:uncharacterized protein (TIGR00661 family)
VKVRGHEIDPRRYRASMRVLYGVVGEGMGHATRSRVVIEHLLGNGHEVHVVVSGRAHRFLGDAFHQRPGFHIDEIAGLHLVVEDNALDRSESLQGNVAGIPKSVAQNLAVYAKALGREKPEVVISDFESCAYFYGKAEAVPVVSIDNMQILSRCRIPDDVAKSDASSLLLARLAVKSKLPGAYHYLVTSFFFPPVRKRRTSLVPPILRPEILAARREPGDHLVVYQTAEASTHLLPALRSLGVECRVYGSGREGDDGSLRFRAFSQTGFVDDLRTARAVVASAGFSLMSECVHLRVPMLAVPIEKQFEQELNAQMLAREGFGAHARTLDRETLARFVDEAPAYQEALATYAPRDNGMLLAAVDELLADIERGAPPSDVLATETLGDRLTAITS